VHVTTLQQLLRRQPDTNKYDFGHVLVVGGSAGMVGAPLLAGEAALRSGAGLVTIASHASVVDKLEKRVKEIMTLRLPDSAVEAHDILQTFIRDRKVSAVVLGPGQTAAWEPFDIDLLQALDIPAVIDAGALRAFTKNLTPLQALGSRNGNLILTPHAGEYARLTGDPVPADRSQLRQTVSQFAESHHVTLILKGQRTLVAHPDGKLYENTSGNPGMATAGTGDVLAGMIAGILAQGIAAAEAAEAGVYLHGLAGDLAAEAKTEPGMIASDLISQIPVAFKIAERKTQ